MVGTSARNNGGNEATPSTFPTPKTAQDNGKAAPATPGTRGRASNPTPKALFTRAPKHNKPRANRSSWDTGPPPAATDAQGKSGPIRQPPVEGERAVAVDTSVATRLQAEKATAPMPGPPDTPEAPTTAPAAVGVSPDTPEAITAPAAAGVPSCDTAPARTPAPRRQALRICYAFKSRSPKEIYKLFYFAMDHPELDVDVPQDLARCAADLAKMRRTKGSDWQKCRDKLYDYIGGNVLVILADFDEQYKRSPEDELSWGHTYITQPHASHTYMQDARRAVEEPVHPPTPAPHHTHTTPNPPLLTPPLNQSPHLLAAWDNGENAENAQEKAEDGGVNNAVCC